MERFIKEYANYKIEGYEGAKELFPNNPHFQERIEMIEKVVRAAQNKHITIDEAMIELAAL